MINVSSDELLKILKENRKRHRRVFTEALDGYRKQLQAELERHIAELKAGRAPEVHIRLIRPEDHTRDYDRIIRMVEMHKSPSSVFTLDESHFAQYVEDDWSWRRQFITSANAYAGDTVVDVYGVDAANGG